jgi:membrane-bound lytic murein transglycosylase D
LKRLVRGPIFRMRAFVQWRGCMPVTRKLALGLFAVVMAGSALSAAPARADEPPPAREARGPSGDPFPAPPGLREQVEFWKSVFASWSRAEVALHDAVRPGLVYAVVELPGDAGGEYTREQREFVRFRQRALEAALARMERKIAAREEIDDAEKELALKICTTAGIAWIEGAHTRVRSQRGLRERFRRGLEISGRYDAEFRRVFREARLPEDLALLPHVESSFQASARSSAGAVGIWQFTRPAARKFMLYGPAIDERLDPVAAARGAARYLRDAYETLGDWALAVTSYNHGVEGMSRAHDRFGTDFERIVREYDGRSFGFASRNFYAEFLAAREIARDPARFFPEGIRYEAPLAQDRVVLEKRMTPLQVARAYGLPLGELAGRNPAWTRRAVRDGQALPAGTEVWLPSGTLARLAGVRAPEPPPSDPRPAATEPLPTAADRTPAARTTDATGSVIVHVVRRGETLFKIAASYGVRVSDLLESNQLNVESTIRPGQHVRVPLAR